MFDSARSRALALGIVTTAGVQLAVLGAHAVAAGSPLAAVQSVDAVSDYVMLAGVPGGLVAGALTHEYGSAMKDGLIAGAAGLAVVAVVVAGFGTALSLSRGFGADSLLAFLFTAPALIAFTVLVPIVALEGAAASVLANELKIRVSRWRETA